MKINLVSVIIPAYNEEENFNRGVLVQVESYLKTSKFNWEVLLINDGSIDKTLKLLLDFAKNHPGFRVVNIKHAGKLKAIKAGMDQAKGDIVLFSDFDQSTPISEFAKFIKEFEGSADVVIGSRVGLGAERINDPPFRYFRSRILNYIIKLFLFRGIDDTQCGFKAFRREAAERLFVNLKATYLAKPKGGFMGPFDIELLFLAKKYKYNVSSVPVVWQYFPSKKLSVLAEPLRFLYDIFVIKKLDFLGKYNV